MTRDGVKLNCSKKGRSKIAQQKYQEYNHDRGWIQTPNSDQVKKKEDLEYNHNKGWSVTKLLKKGRARIQP